MHQVEGINVYVNNNVPIKADKGLNIVLSGLWILKKLSVDE